MGIEADQVIQLQELIVDLRTRRAAIKGPGLECAQAVSRLGEAETRAHATLAGILRKAGPETLTALPDDVLRSKLDEVEARIKKLRAGVS